MGTSSRTTVIALLLCLSCLVVDSNAQRLRGIQTQFNSWSMKNVKYTPDGRGVDLVLDRLSAAGIGSKTSYLFGGFGAWIKLPANNSAGTVTTFYMSSPNPYHCEFDFEFLGNETGKPFLLHTNIFVNGTGGREQQIYLPFDPTAAYHYYNFQWNKDLLVFYVDNTPIRMFRNLEGIIPGFMYPNVKPMNIYLSIWDGSSWATQGGRVKIDWAASPFVASYQKFRLNGCVANANDAASIANCQNSKFAAPGPRAQKLNIGRIRQMRVVKATQVKYNYCDDRPRYPTPPPECAFNTM
ncbi:hypothetical protein M758_5G116900 [Ceratodon purpureus]|uniref:Xyloglucan endotransglucosylase/hydrolase n=1 Tax=Ceratodon purpureus TaxID=3225 RepID=A0A8T0I2E6_CERPU|nr:hypothetical protein KC19_5G111300 [Ceratodon purpureus]KAG0616453.1 hypothetical protein M758_5G116900 [Ceratodon purpureus]